MYGLHHFLSQERQSEKKLKRKIEEEERKNRKREKQKEIVSGLGLAKCRHSSKHTLGQEDYVSFILCLLSTSLSLFIRSLFLSRFVSTSVRTSRIFSSTVLFSDVPFSHLLLHCSYRHCHWELIKARTIDMNRERRRLYVPTNWPLRGSTSGYFCRSTRGRQRLTSSKKKNRFGCVCMCAYVYVCVCMFYNREGAKENSLT